MLGGDFNVTVVTSPTLRSLGTPEWGFSPRGKLAELVFGCARFKVEVVAADERPRERERQACDHRVQREQQVDLVAPDVDQRALDAREAAVGCPPVDDGQSGDGSHSGQLLELLPMSYRAVAK